MPEPKSGPEPKNGHEPEQALTFEQAYAELEQTAQALQQGQLSLDETLRLYERGSFLARYCIEKLDGVELKVTQLLTRPDGSYTTKSITSEKEVVLPEPPTGEPADDPSRDQRALFD